MKPPPLVGSPVASRTPGRKKLGNPDIESVSEARQGLDLSPRTTKLKPQNRVPMQPRAGREASNAELRLLLAPQFSDPIADQHAVTVHLEVQTRQEVIVPGDGSESPIPWGIQDRMPAALMAILAANLRRLRGLARTSQQQLANVAGIHRNTIARIELQEMQTIDLETAVRLAQALNVAVDDLIAPPHEQPANVRESLGRFLASDFALSVSEDERRMLETLAWPWGAPTPEGWYHALQAIRVSKTDDKDPGRGRPIS
jgi:transcriptional regulator with XRE-family HTH domain